MSRERALLMSFKPGCLVPAASRALYPVLLPVILAAQSVPPELASDRADYATWLATAPISPLAAIAQQPVGRGITLGPPESDIPLAGLPLTRVTEENGVLLLTQGDSARRLTRGRMFPAGPYVLVPSGSPGTTTLGVYGTHRQTLSPAYYPYDSALVFSIALTPLTKPHSVRVLSLDGVQVDAVEMGTVRVSIDGTTAALRVYRIPDPSTGENELTIYFRDGTSGLGSYPAGRFVVLIPQSGGRLLLDFNRARNPFCAYSSAYACPVPWPGNTLEDEVRAGEMYSG